MKRPGADRALSGIPVSSFFETAAASLNMEQVGGKAGLQRKIPEATLNRPGLAFSGFFQHFAHRRVQVVGMAEHSYLGALTSEERALRLRGFFEKKVPCLVVTRGRRIFPEMMELGEEFRTPVFRTNMITKHFINAATFILENLMAPRTQIQGTMVEIQGIGVLIEGKPGTGKSETALGLIKRGYALVSDDVTALRLDSSGAVIASPVSVTRYHMEIRGLGIVHVPSLFGVTSVRNEKRLDLVVTLLSEENGVEDDRSGDTRFVETILGVEIPQIFIHVAPGRELWNLVETAALDQKLRKLGHDAAKELDEQLMALLTGGQNGSE